MTLAITSRRSAPEARPGLDAATQIAMLVALWTGYAAVRHVTGDTQRSALGNAARLLEVESTLGLDVEAVLQSAVGWPHLFVAANTYYLIHFPVTLAVVVLTFWRHRETVYSALRNSLIGSTVVALLVHLAVPMAPPRMLPGFVDAGAEFGPDPYAIAGSESANQFAAMPSLHVAWAVLVGCAFWRLSGGRIVRCLAVVHPLATSLVVVITGHHFITDVAIGAALAIGFAALTNSSPFSSAPSPSTDGTPAEPR